MKASVISSVWLTILRSQEPLNRSQLRKMLPELSPNQLSPAISVAFQKGYLERTEDERQFRYRVTPRCNVPVGVTVLEILEATS